MRMLPFISTGCSPLRLGMGARSAPEIGKAAQKKALQRFCAFIA
jgi:hypothetical protein